MDSEGLTPGLLWQLTKFVHSPPMANDKTINTIDNTIRKGIDKT